MNTQPLTMAQIASACADPGSAMPDRAARFLKAIANKDRLRVLCGLLDGELPVAAIEAKLDTSQSALSQHLARLKAEGVVSSRRRGRQVLYSIADKSVLEVIELLYRRFHAAGPA